ncbi:protein phosphatase 2C domain-containing protein, partial [Cellulomonas endophytica]|uniref:protein phosphatase 2C domain-containing protein n=1 Tax=Cellulomonas endophytica TaxID=2494735 RepID=UPI00196AB811
RPLDGPAPGQAPGAVPAAGVAPDEGALRDALDAARAAVDALPAASERAPGTTLTAVLLVEGPALLVAHVGDSRAYRLAGGSDAGPGTGLERLTTDHTLVAELVRAGLLTPEEARHDPRRHVVTRALGAGEPAVRHGDDVRRVPAAAGDRLLLCSDGLTDELDDAALAAVLREEADPRRAAERLVALALDAGGRDNATALVADLVASSRTAPAAPAAAADPAPGSGAGPLA